MASSVSNRKRAKVDKRRAAYKDVQPADFRAMRESLGLSQRNVAEAAGVQVLAVKRWESGDRSIPPEVWHWLRETAKASDKAVLETVKQTMAKYGLQHKRPTVWLQYYRDQADYDLRRSDGDPYGLANANARKVASQLGMRGIVCRFCYPPRAVAKAAREAAAKSEVEQKSESEVESRKPAKKSSSKKSDAKKSTAKKRTNSRKKSIAT